MSAPPQTRKSAKPPTTAAASTMPAIGPGLSPLPQVFDALPASGLSVSSGFPPCDGGDPARSSRARGPVAERRLRRRVVLDIRLTPRSGVVAPLRGDRRLFTPLSVSFSTAATHVGSPASRLSRGAQQRPTPRPKERRPSRGGCRNSRNTERARRFPHPSQRGRTKPNTPLTAVTSEYPCQPVETPPMMLKRHQS